MGLLLTPGDLVASKYRVVRELGRGGMGVVYEAINLTTDGRVALKVLNLNERDDAESVARFSREARTAGRLRSRFVARVFDHDRTEDGMPFLVMELLEGTNLSAVVKERGALPIPEAIGYLVQACAGVAEAHRAGIIHRDLKPSNLFIDNNEALVRVLDFGVSKMLGADDELTSSNAMVGTYSYMSPEQLRASRDVDSRSDVWALGIILYRMLEGRLPYAGTAAEVGARVLDVTPVPRITRTEAPAALVALVARALDKNASARFANAGELGQALAPFADTSAMTSLALSELGARGGSSASIAVATDGANDGTTTTKVRSVAPADPTPSTKATFILPRKRPKMKTPAWPLVAAGVIAGIASVFTYRYFNPDPVRIRTSNLDADPGRAPSFAAPPAPSASASTVIEPPAETPPVPAPAASSAAPIKKKVLPPPRPAKTNESDNPARL